MSNDNPARELSALPVPWEARLPFCPSAEEMTQAMESEIKEWRAYGLLCRQQSTSDTARLDRLEAWRLNSLAKGFDGDTFQLTVDRPIREQLDAVQAQAPVQGGNDAASRGQQGGSDAADAARYRWIVASGLRISMPGSKACRTIEENNAAIDAAIQAQAGEGAQGGGNV